MMTEFQNAKTASRELVMKSDVQINAMLNVLADTMVQSNNIAEILSANALDLEKMERSNPLYDRLLLTESRIRGIAADMKNVAQLPSPLGHVLKEKTLANGLRLRRVSVPFGVIGVIYEARPNVTFDVFSLCVKAGSACVLKGGKDAENTNRAACRLIKEVMHDQGFDTDIIQLLPSTHEATEEMLNAVGFIDLCIPRGGKKLIEFVRDNARVPVIETGAGVVHTYFDRAGNLEMGKKIILNGKTRRVSVCNALDCLIVHEERLADLASLVAPLAEKNVTIFADNSSYLNLKGKYPYLEQASESDFGREWMDYKLSVKTVASLDDALQHIREFGSGHSESIITDDPAAVSRFQLLVDAACVYHNAPTSFTDGAQFGLGAEIGISTQKLGPRGPMALEEITSYKWLIEGEGQVRE